METSNLPGQPVSVLGHHHREKKFSLYSGGTSHISICSHCLLLCHWAQEECIALLFSLPLGIHRHRCGSHQPSFLFFLNSSRSLRLCITGEMLKFPKHLCGASPDSMPISLFYWGAQILIQYFRCGLNRTWIISNATKSISKIKTPKIMSGILKLFFLLCSILLGNFY